MLREHGGAVEADLLHHFHIDYMDRWRFDGNGQRRLTLRRLAVLLLHLPPDSSTRRALGLPTWTRADHLIADVFAALVKADHPGRPVVAAPPDPARAEREAAFKARAAERQRQIDAGEIT